jgi:cytochrome b involved in lipid metabolism
MDRHIYYITKLQGLVRGYLTRNTTVLNPVKLPVYALPEIQRHNTRKDAWIDLFGYVYDVTDWISSHAHPGGDSILKGIGKEYSQEWKRVSSHQMTISDISKLLDKYLIGRYDSFSINTI